MTNEEYLKRINDLYAEVSKADNKRYVINPPQMEKFTNVLNFFRRTAKDCAGTVEPLNLVPSELHGGITATFLAFGVHGDQVQELCNVLKDTSAITIDATDDGVCISVTVPRVFIGIEDK